MRISISISISMKISISISIPKKGKKTYNVNLINNI